MSSGNDQAPRPFPQLRRSRRRRPRAQFIVRAQMILTRAGVEFRDAEELAFRLQDCHEHHRVYSGFVIEAGRFEGWTLPNQGLSIWGIPLPPFGGHYLLASKVRGLPDMTQFAADIRVGPPEGAEATAVTRVLDGRKYRDTGWHVALSRSDFTDHRTYGFEDAPDLSCSITSGGALSRRRRRGGLFSR